MSLHDSFKLKLSYTELKWCVLVLYQQFFFIVYEFNKHKKWQSMNYPTFLFQ